MIKTILIVYNIVKSLPKKLIMKSFSGKDHVEFAREECNLYCKITNKMPVVFHDDHVIIQELGKFDTDTSTILSTIEKDKQI